MGMYFQSLTQLIFIFHLKVSTVISEMVRCLSRSPFVGLGAYIDKTMATGKKCIKVYASSTYTALSISTTVLGIEVCCLGAGLYELPVEVDIKHPQEV